MISRTISFPSLLDFSPNTQIQHKHRKLFHVTHQKAGCEKEAEVEKKTLLIHFSTRVFFPYLFWFDDFVHYEPNQNDFPSCFRLSYFLFHTLCYYYYTIAGNQAFRKLVEEYAPQYMEAKTKHQKSDTIETVIQKVRTNGGSFLRKDPVHNHWFHVDEIKARDKVCQ